MSSKWLQRFEPRCSAKPVRPGLAERLLGTGEPLCAKTQHPG